jgi:hypothetical protein
MRSFKRLGAISAVAGLAALGVAAMPGQANAWWRGPGIGIGLWVPPVVVAPPPVYAPPPAYYAPPAAYYAPAPQGVWVPPHWQGGYWFPAIGPEHWA